MSSISEALAALIQAAKDAGLTSDELIATLVSNWDVNAQPVGRPTLDTWGRMKVKDHWIFAPFPISEKWDGLTDFQIGHIRVNSCVDALGRWKYQKDGKTVYVAAAFQGFDNDAVVSWQSARKYKIVTQDDGTTTWRLDGNGYFHEPTLRTRFGSLKEIQDYMFHDSPAL